MPSYDRPSSGQPCAAQHSQHAASVQPLAVRPCAQPSKNQHHLSFPFMPLLQKAHQDNCQLLDGSNDMHIVIGYHMIIISYAHNWSYDSIWFIDNYDDDWTRVIDHGCRGEPPRAASGLWFLWAPVKAWEGWNFRCPNSANDASKDK